MDNLPDLKDSESFLSKVEEIGSLIKGLADCDESNQEEAKHKADEYLKKLNKDDCRVVKSNKNVINNRPTTAGDSPGVISNGDDKEAFMRMMEQDAKDRAERRKKDEKLAMEQKELGNEQFKMGNFEKAVEYYSEGLRIFKNTTVLWTNRAQAYIKLGEYEKALSDCDWATRVFENCLKAYIHQGKAHLGLKQFDQAIESYERAIKIEPKKKAIIENYIKEVEVARVTEEQERRVREREAYGDAHAQGLEGVLNHFNQEGQLVMYYSGGLGILAQDMRTNEESKTLFRMKGGMRIIESHFLLSKCFNASPRSLGRDEIALCEAAIDTMKAACTNNDENQLQFLELTDICTKLTRFLETKMKTAKTLKKRIAELLLLLTECEISRRKMMNLPDVFNLMTCLLRLINARGTDRIALSVLNNFALTSKFKAMVRENCNEVLPMLEEFMINEESKLDLLTQCITTITNLCGDPQLLSKFMLRKQLWDACVTLLERHVILSVYQENKEVVRAALGLLFNLSQRTNENLDTHTRSLMSQCLKLFDNSLEDSVLLRSLMLTSLILQHSKYAGEFTSREPLILHCINGLHSEDTEKLKACVKCLALCTNNDSTARKLVLQHRDGVESLLKHLKHSDEALVGNAALCLGHCTETSAALCERLAQSNIIMELLVLARDARKPTAAHNCAILIAKLCKGDTRHLEKLRELHGLEILHDVLKNVKV